MTPEERQRLQKIAAQNSIHREEEEQRRRAARWEKMTEAERAEAVQGRAIAAEFFETNKSISAMVRDDERAAARAAKLPVDLRALPREEWDRYLQYDVVLSPAVQRYLDGNERWPLTAEEVDGLADQVGAFHGVTTPYFIVVSPDMEATGRAWKYVPEVAPFVSGFYLDRD